MNERMRAQVPYAGEMDVSPWEALLAEVRQSAFRSAWVDERVEAEAETERKLIAQEHDWEAEAFAKARVQQSRELRAWLDQSRLERAHKANVARAAVSAGLSERYIASVQAEARMVANVLQRALQAAGMTSEQTEAAHAELRVALAEVGRELQMRHAAAGPHVRERPEIEG